MTGQAKIALALLIALNYTDDAETLQRSLDKQTAVEQEQESKYSGKVIIVKSNVPMYTDTSKTDQVTTLEKGTLLYRGDEKDGLLEVSNDNLCGYIEPGVYNEDDVEGYAKSFGLKQQGILISNAPAFAAASYNSKVITNLHRAQKFSNASIVGEFVKLDTKEHNVCYVAKSLVQLDYEFTDIVIEEELEDTSDCEYGVYKGIIGASLLNRYENNDGSSGNLRTEIVNKALSYVGGKYVWGGTNLETGVDCSGFVQQIYKQFGYSLPRNSRYQAESFTAITQDQLQPGDLVFYSANGVVNHVAMYAGDGYIVHASNKKPYPQGGIKVSKMLYKNPVKFVRVVN